jgi:hypothetical protein
MCTVSNKYYLRSVGTIDTCNYSTIRMLSSTRSRAKQRRRRLKGQVKSTKQKDGFNHNGNLQQLTMCGTTAELHCMRLSVTSSYIKHDGCLLVSLYSCDTVLVERTDEAKAKWLQLAAMAKDELQGMRLSVTSS